MSRLFGPSISAIRAAFFNLPEADLDELLDEYGERYGKSAKSYAQKTFPKWKSGETKLSGQTIERLIELTPPYLSQEERYRILRLLLKHHKPKSNRSVHINLKEPEAGLSQLLAVMEEMKHIDLLSFLPDQVMEAATWLYSDDVTAARAMLAEATRKECSLIRASAIKEIELLERTIKSGQIKTASYSVELPNGMLSVTASIPSKCFIASVCFGENAPETNSLRDFRDFYLRKRSWGRKFVAWYYLNGDRLSRYISKTSFRLGLTRLLLKIITKIIKHFQNTWMK